jgi:peptide/nickel transport system substrate-binding protein
MNKARLLTPLALAGLLATGALPYTQHSVSHAAHAGLPGKGQGGTVIDGLYEEPDRLIPNTSSMTYAFTVADTLFAPLFYTDGKGALQLGIVSEMPTAANGDISKDGLSYTFKLRPGLKWSDGQALDARDLDFSWKLWTNKDLIINSNAGLDHIASTTISSDNLSITYHLKSRYAPFVAAFADQYQPVPAHVFQGMTAKQVNTSAFANKPTVVSGPFMIQSRKAGDNITEVPNPNYYKPGQPYLGKLIFRIIPDQVAITNALRTHEIDMSWFLDVSQIDTLKAISGNTYVPGVAPNIEQGLLNEKNPILQDVRVRQALEYGLDRPSMIKDVWKGGALPMAADIAPGFFGHNNALKPYPFDPVMAGKLLDAAGWKLGSDNRRYKNGKVLSLRWSTTARNQWRAQDELIALQSYQNLGIQLSIVNYPAGTYFGSILPGGNYDIGEFENGFLYDPDSTMFTAFQSGQTPPHGSNWGWYKSTAYDKALAAEEAATDAASRSTAFAQAEVLMNRDMPSLWLYDPPNIYSYSNHLHNYVPGPISGESWNADSWYKS